ncbi:MAG: hypothetical protein KDA89_21990, partial [Planctomycetaceae bacterium]|nr:hypothetical protein [Planctomycetaceae bacterium]
SCDQSDVVLQLHKGAVNAVAVSPGDDLFATAGEDGKVVLVSFEGFQIIGTIDVGAGSPVLDIQFLRDGKTIAAITPKTLSLWRVRDQSQGSKFELSGKDVFKHILENRFSDDVIVLKHRNQVVIVKDNELTNGSFLSHPSYDPDLRTATMALLDDDNVVTWDNYKTLGRRYSKHVYRQSFRIKDTPHDVELPLPSNPAVGLRQLLAYDPVDNSGIVFLSSSDFDRGYHPSTYKSLVLASPLAFDAASKFKDVGIGFELRGSFSGPRAGWVNAAGYFMANKDGQLLFWRRSESDREAAANLRPRFPFRWCFGHKGEITDLGIWKDRHQTLAISTSVDGSCRIWDLERYGAARWGYNLVHHWTTSEEGTTVEYWERTVDSLTRQLDPLMYVNGEWIEKPRNFGQKTQAIVTVTTAFGEQRKLDGIGTTCLRITDRDGVTVLELWNNDTPIRVASFVNNGLGIIACAADWQCRGWFLSGSNGE